MRLILLGRKKLPVRAVIASVTRSIIPLRGNKLGSMEIENELKFYNELWCNWNVEPSAGSLHYRKQHR